MNKEDKEILLKDLCARLPYGVKIQVPYEDGSGYFDETVWEVNNDGPFHVNGWGIEYEYVKPYLFPLSSMTKEQKRELLDLTGYKTTTEAYCGFDSMGYYTNIVGEYEEEEGEESFIFYPDYKGIEWFIKNHFDFRGLIEKGLALDATGKNIY